MSAEQWATETLAAMQAAHEDAMRVGRLNMLGRGRQLTKWECFRSRWYWRIDCVVSSLSWKVRATWSIWARGYVED